MKPILKWLFIIILTVLVPEYIFPQDAPVSVAGNCSTFGDEATISIKAYQFSNIVSCNLELRYDPAIATCKSVTPASLLGGNINTNLGFPGRILIGWYAYPGVTLEDSTVIFSIEFDKTDTGTTTITWYDDGYSCIYYDENAIPLNDLPHQEYYFDGSITFLPAIAPIMTVLPASGCMGESVGVQVLGEGFRNIGKCRLELQYDPSSIIFKSFTGYVFPGLTLNHEEPGKIILEGISEEEAGISFDDGSILITLNFTITGEATLIEFDHTDSSCFFQGPSPEFVLMDDTPFNLHYYGGMLTSIPVPDPAGEIEGPQNGYVCRGEQDVTLTVDSIPGATLYDWVLPQGILLSDGVHSRFIRVSVGGDFRNGYVRVKGVNNCGAGDESQGFFLVDTTSIGLIDHDKGIGNNELRIDHVRRISAGEIEVSCYISEDGFLVADVFTLSGRKGEEIIIGRVCKGANILKFSDPDPGSGILILRIRHTADHRTITCTGKVVLLND